MHMTKRMSATRPALVNHFSPLTTYSFRPARCTRAGPSVDSRAARCCAATTDASMTAATYRECAQATMEAMVHDGAQT